MGAWVDRFRVGLIGAAAVCGVVALFKPDLLAVVVVIMMVWLITEGA